MVDDNGPELAALAEMLKTELARIGQVDAEIAVFSSGEAFLAGWTAGAYDLILLDIFLDGMDGDTLRVRTSQAEMEDLLLVYFRQQTEACGAALRVSVDIPVRPGIPDQTLVALLSNLLENAVDACGLVGGNAAYITVVVKNLDDAMFFRVENPCVVTPVRDWDGTFFSTKHEGKGVGLASVQAIAEQYEGMMTV